MRTLWLSVPAAIPWMLELTQLYPWARPGSGAQLSNSFYLNRPFFFGRAAVYLLCWLGLGALASRALQSEQPDAALARIAPGGLIVLALTITFSAIDLTLSLDPHFTSSVFGLITMSEIGLFALSVAVLAAALAMPGGTVIARPDSSELRGVLGKLLLGLVLLWAYLDFMQLLIVWESDLPGEAAWYLRRTSGPWGTTAAAITAAHFVLPWCALIWPPIRRSPRGIAVVAGLLALSAIVRTWWLVVPASGSGFAPIDVATMLCMLGVGAAGTLAVGERHGG